MDDQRIWLEIIWRNGVREHDEASEEPDFNNWLRTVSYTNMSGMRSTYPLDALTCIRVGRDKALVVPENKEDIYLADYSDDEVGPHHD